MSSEPQIESVTVISGGFGVIEDGLIRDADIEDILQDEGGLSGADGEGDVEGQDEAEDVLGVVNSPDVDGGFAWSGVKEVSGLEQIFTVDVAEFELGRFSFL